MTFDEFSSFLSNNSTILKAGAELASKLIGLAIEYLSASAEKRAELLDEADQHYLEFRQSFAAFDEVLAKTDAKVDADVDAKFPKTVAPLKQTEAQLPSGEVAGLPPGPTLVTKLPPTE